MLILASASPRRGEILKLAGIPFVKMVPRAVDEAPRAGEEPRKYVMRLARTKAEAVLEAGLTDAVALGADTTVVVDGQMLGKPTDQADAARMLRLLAGRRHEVLTGICLTNGVKTILDAASSGVWFAEMTAAEIDEYVASGEPMDKAGAYAIQGLASKFIEKVEGCYFNVVGLPVALVYRRLRAEKAFMI